MNIWRIAEALQIHPSAFFAAPDEDEIVTSGRIRSRGNVPAAKPPPAKDGSWTKKGKR